MKNQPTRHIPLILSVIAAILFAACGGSAVSRADAPGDTIHFRHARLITMVRYPDYVKVEVANPWGGGILATYALCPDSSRNGSPEGYRAALSDERHNVQRVNVPLRNALVFSAIHCGLFCELGCEASIGGVCESQYVHCLTHPVVDCGNSMSPNQERILQLRPDAMLVSPFENNTANEKLTQLGVPVIQCAEYMESTALGRAEWMRFFGLLVGRGAEADSLFEAVEARYDSLRRQPTRWAMAPSGQCIRILSELPYGNVWYQPGGQSVVGQLYADAGAQLAFPDSAQSGSLPLSTEQVLAAAHDADVWIFRYSSPHDKTLDALGAEAEVYRRFDAFRRGDVWGCNTETTRIFDEAGFHPDRLLSDIIRICHPELQQDEPLHYYKRLTKEKN